MNKSMKKPILIAISLILFGLLCWGVYSGMRNVKNNLFESGLSVGGYNGFLLGQQNGFQIAVQAVLKQLERDGQVTIQSDNQTVILIPNDNLTKN